MQNRIIGIELHLYIVCVTVRHLDYICDRIVHYGMFGFGK